MNKDLTIRTPGEDLWLRRRHAGLTTSEAAALLGVGRTRLWLAETDQDPLAARFLPWSRITGLQDLLALARRRLGKGSRGTARLMGISHSTLHEWEAAGDPRLREWWEGKGFTFVR